MVQNRKIKNKLFDNYNNKQKKYLPIYSINIHKIVQLNQNIGHNKIDLERSSDIMLLKSVVKRCDLMEYLSCYKLNREQKRRYYNYKKWLNKIKNQYK